MSRCSKQEFAPQKRKEKHLNVFSEGILFRFICFSRTSIVILQFNGWCVHFFDDLTNGESRRKTYELKKLSKCEPSKIMFLWHVTACYGIQECPRQRCIFNTF